MIKRVMAKVDACNSFVSADESECYVRLTLLGEEHVSFGGPETLRVGIDEKELAAFRERLGKTVCLVIEDA